MIVDVCVFQKKNQEASLSLCLSLTIKKTKNASEYAHTTTKNTYMYITVYYETLYLL